MPINPTNFQQVIERSGLKKQDIAKAKGIRPATLSRQLSGAIGMTLDDAYQYAEILNCTPQEIMFALEDVPVVLRNLVHYCADEQHWQTAWTREVFIDPPLAHIYAPSYFGGDLAAAVHRIDKDYQGPMVMQGNAIDLVLLHPIRDKIVHHKCTRQMSYVSITGDYEMPISREKTNILLTMVYPQPSNKYTLFNPWTKQKHENVSLEWATPVCANIPLPEVLYENVTPSGIEGALLNR